MRPLVVPIVCVLVLAACGASPAPAGTATTSPAAAATGGGAPPAPTASARPSGPGFLDIAGAAKTATYKVSYRVTAGGGGAALSGEQTWYVRGAVSRFDFRTAQGSISAFDLEDGYYVCFGAAGQSATCLSTPKDQALSGNPAAAFDIAVRDQPGSLDPTFDGTQQIAGQTAQCFGVKGSVLGGGQWRACYSSSGIPLLISTKDSGSEYTMEATSFSTTVTDADLKLPATPVRLGR